MKHLWIVLITFPALLNAQSPAYHDTVFTSYFERTSGWTAGDATISIPTPEGESIWLFGDSHIDDFQASDSTIACLFQVRNAIMVQDILNPSAFRTILDDQRTGVARTPVKVLPDDGTFFWPGHGYAKPDTAIVFWLRYNNSLALEGTYYTRISTQNLRDASAIGELQEVPWTKGFEFGNAVVVDSSAQYIYIYGQKKDWIILRPYVARIPVDRDVSGEWEFYTGDGWSANVDEAAQLMGSTNDYVSASFSVLKLQNKYYMISQDIGFLTCGLGREIYSWESESPAGPFVNKKLLYTIEDQYQGQYWVTYNATAHPEFIKDNELLISYNLNGLCDPPECENAFTDRRKATGYRPKFIRVPLDYIDPELNVPDPEYPKVFSLNVTERENRVQIFPNPSFDGTFFLRTGNLSGGQVRVYRMDGELVMSRKVAGMVQIRLNNSGIYVLRIQKGAVIQEYKVVIK